MLRYTLLEGIKTIFSLAFALALTLCIYLLGQFSLPKGEGGEFYLYSTSSRATIVQNPQIEELLFITGQCERYKVEDFDRFFTAIKREYEAQVRFEEGDEYFLYSPRVQGGIRLNGYFVNLHVIRRGEEVKIGTPIIFGGY